jgi:predicted DNA-binding protein with PD1-like motif
MKYTAGSIGRVFVAKFEDGDNILEELAQTARKENIKGAIFHLIGGIKQGNIVVGPEKESLPPVPIWRNIEESHELIGTGTIFWEGDDPKIHLHGAFGKRDEVKVGCLRQSSETFLVLEAVILELIGMDARREFDDASGLTLLKI